jgi:dihydroorotate dehydrogenase electron transfer subunit
MPTLQLAELVEKKQIKPDIYKYSIQVPEIVKTAKPGNFIEIRITEGTDPFLRRPISIYQLIPEKGILEFIFQVKGKGTEKLSQKQVGDKIDVLGPLGFGTFKTEGKQKLAIIGGGIGIFPLYELAKEAKAEGKEVYTYLGFRNKDFVMLEEEFKQVSTNLTITTDDGSYQEKGFAINYLEKELDEKGIEAIYACGPLPMLKAVQKLAEEKNREAQISLEERMGCGIGACLGCAVKTAKSPKEAPEYWHVCKAGPVFKAQDVEI